MYFRRAMYCISQFKRFSDPNITKNVAKKTVFNSIVYLIQEKTLDFKLTTTQN